MTDDLRSQRPATVLEARPAGASRRTVLAAAVAVGAGAIGLAAATAARAQSKQKQAEVQYQGSPKDGQKCEGCALFQAPNACQAVEGQISPEGWCSLYSPKG